MRVLKIASVNYVTERCLILYFVGERVVETERVNVFIKKEKKFEQSLVCTIAENRGYAK